MENLWNTIFFQPLFNVLIILYNNFTNFNMGLAVVYLTLILRVFLLPLTIFSEKSKNFYEELSEKIKEIQNDYPNDVVKQKETVKGILRKNRLFPWAKSVSLGIQALVLILLYQVFLGGINIQSKKEFLYSFVTLPDFIESQFLWVNIGERDFLLAFLVAVVLFIDISFIQRRRKKIITNRDVGFRILFPIFTLIILYFLASVKSIFILTSLLFSFIIIVSQNLFWLLTKPSEKKKIVKKEEAEEDVHVVGHKL